MLPTYAEAQGWKVELIEQQLLPNLRREESVAHIQGRKRLCAAQVRIRRGIGCSGCHRLRVRRIHNLCATVAAACQRPKYSISTLVPMTLRDRITNAQLRRRASSSPTRPFSRRITHFADRGWLSTSSEKSTAPQTRDRESGASKRAFI